MLKFGSFGTSICSFGPEMTDPKVGPSSGITAAGVGPDSIGVGESVGEIVGAIESVVLGLGESIAVGVGVVVSSCANAILCCPSNKNPGATELKTRVNPRKKENDFLSKKIFLFTIKFP